MTPRYWPSWLGLAILRASALLPSGLTPGPARFLGRALRFLMPYRRCIAETNLRLCFPELSRAKRDRLAKEHFSALGMGLMEMALAWWAPTQKLEKLMVELEGREHLAAALQRGKGALLVTAHFTPFEIGGRLLAEQIPLTVVYRHFKNPVFHRAMLAARHRHTAQAIDRRDLRGVIRALRENRLVWYAPDQDAGRRGVVAPFFGIPTATHGATTRIARLSGAPVLPYSVHRLPGCLCYRLTIHPPLDGFPSDDVVQDATRINALLETSIRAAPEQYLWVHRRFKTRPHGAPSFYPSRPRRVPVRPMRRLSSEEFAKLTKGSQVLSRDDFGNKVLRTPNGTIIKLFRIKRLISSAWLRSYAQRFSRNAVLLHGLTIPTVEVCDVFRLSEPRRDGVLYRELYGEPLCHVLPKVSPAHAKQVLTHFAAFVALLHDKGVYFRSLHLGNVLVLDADRFGLIDVSDLRVRRRALGPWSRLRNLRHLLRRPEDRALMTGIGLDLLFRSYLDGTGVGPLQRNLISRLVARAWPEAAAP